MALMKPKEAAGEFRVSTSWLYANRHQIGFVQLSERGIRFEKDDVERYIEDRRRGPEKRTTKWESQSHTEATARNGSSEKRTTVDDISSRLQAIEKERSKRRNTQRSA